MIEALKRFDKVTTAGILARTALSLPYVAPPLQGRLPTKSSFVKK
jgi:hypothetical protein